MNTQKFKTFYKLSESESAVLKEKYYILSDKNIEDKNENITEEQQYDVLQSFHQQSNGSVNINVGKKQSKKNFTIKIVTFCIIAIALITVGTMAILNINKTKDEIVGYSNNGVTDQNSLHMEIVEGNVNGIWWKLSNNILTLSGTGEITPEIIQNIRENISYIETENDELADEYYYDINGITHGYIDPIKAIIIKDGITSIGDQPFSYGVRNFVSITIPNSVENIGNACFYGCHKLETIVLPSKITEVTDWCFADCVKLSDITFLGAISKIGHGAFCECNNLRNIIIPESVTMIGDEVFEGCTSLTEITIPDSVKHLGGKAFQNCSNLSTVVLSKELTVIPGSQFIDCYSLNEIDIPDGVTIIHYEAFSGCKSLSKVSIPKSVTTISGRAFRGCSNLDSITIPNADVTIADDAFESNVNIKIGIND